MTRRIVIFTDDPGWHGRQLKRAFARRGYAADYLSLTDCRVDLSQASGVAIPGFGHALPDGVFVRGVPGGTLEQVTSGLISCTCCHCWACRSTTRSAPSRKAWTRP